MKNPVKKHWEGFVPAYVSHPMTSCAHYHCPDKRWENRRYCKLHALRYDTEAFTSDEDNLIVGLDFTRDD